jgi:transcriptional regulator with XRE-family HTH domain
MGHPRPRPERLAMKLREIRRTLGMSQPKLAKRLGVKDYTNISRYELNKLEPPLAVLLAYGRIAGISVESLIDDQINILRNN